MQALSATEAIGPAWDRTRKILFERFAWRRLLKITAVALLAELGSLLTFPGGDGHMRGAHATSHAGVAAVVAMAAISFLVAVVFFVAGLLLFYFGSRMQLVLIEVVATRNTHIGPLWAKYGPPTWRWIGLKLILSLVMFIAIIGAAGWMVFRMVRGMPMPQRGHLPPGFFAHFAVFFIVVFVVAMFIACLYWMMRDFVAPVIALENAPLVTALARLTDLLQDEPGEVFLYLLLRTVMVLFSVIAGEILLSIIMVISIIPFGLVGGLLWLLLHHAGPAGMAVLVLAGLVGGVVLGVWFLFLAIVVFGTICLFYQAFGLYFYGGRYPLLGNLLDPPVVVAQPETAPLLPPMPLAPEPGGVW